MVRTDDASTRFLIEPVSRPWIETG